MSSNTADTTDYPPHVALHPTEARQPVDSSSFPMDSLKDPVPRSTAMDTVNGKSKPVQAPTGFQSTFAAFASTSFIPPRSENVLPKQAADALTEQNAQACADPSAKQQGQTFDYPSIEQQTQAYADQQQEAAISTEAQPGEVVTFIIDTANVADCTDVEYHQYILPDSQVETTMRASGGAAQEPQLLQQQPEPQQEEQQQQFIYLYDNNGQLTPIDLVHDESPLGKQFVRMQDSLSPNICTIIDANQTMVPGQQVYYTQSDDGR